MRRRRRQGRAFPVLAAFLLLISACASGTTNPAHTQPTPTITSGPPATATIPAPPATAHTISAPIERLVELNTAVEAIYIPDQTHELYTFYSDRARRVSVLLEEEDGGVSLRLQARLYNKEGEIIPHVSASVGQPLLRDEWDLPGPGQYTIQVFGPETEARAFALTVISRPTPQTGGDAIAYGESRSGMIEVRGQRDLWLFQGQDGDRILITMTTTDADAYLELYDPAGKLLANNDDTSGSGSNPVLDLRLPADGEYSIVARMYDDDQTGTYRLALELLQ